MDRPHYIVVEGPIGVGKTSLAKLLAENMEARCVFERVDDNPFLSRFYEEREKWAFQTQLFFLLSRFQQQRLLSQQDLFKRTTICDYLFAKDKIFACINLEEDELTLYEQVFKLLDARIPRPDLVIYLQARPEILIKRIRKRAVSFEKGISPAYLEKLVEAYNGFFFQYAETPLLVINTSDIDFVERKGDLENLIREIRGMKGGTQYYLPLGTRA